MVTVSPQTRIKKKMGNYGSSPWDYGPLYNWVNKGWGVLTESQKGLDIFIQYPIINNGLYVATHLRILMMNSTAVVEQASSHYRRQLDSFWCSLERLSKIAILIYWRWPAGENLRINIASIGQRVTGVPKTWLRPMRGNLGLSSTHILIPPCARALLI